MRFIDLFAGLGGFHLGLSTLGHECVFASELSADLRDLYERNFQMKISGDIKKIAAIDIPAHDILCAGFPCQPFSKAGNQDGLDDLDRGTLFYDIVRILEHHNTQFFILENVPNLKTHDNGNTWNKISKILKDDLGYSISSCKLSPHNFGIPQIRERLFIVGCKSGLTDFSWPEKDVFERLNIRQILDNNRDKPLPDRELESLAIWQEFLDNLPRSCKLPSFPIWSMEFGATYPVNGKAPYHMTKNDLSGYRGIYGIDLKGLQKKNQLELLPSYARGKQKNKEFPKWKQNFINQNRDFYNQNKVFIDPVLPKLRQLPPSWQKLEWNCQGEERSIYQNIIQFRGSGIRVKRSNYAPALVASSTTQLPIIGWEGRYISVREAARLQSLDGLDIDLSETQSYHALGNAVNAKVVELIAERLVGKVIEKEIQSQNTLLYEPIV